MNGQSFLRRPGPTKGCQANDDDNDVLHTNLELSSQFALSKLSSITSDPLVLFQLILQCSSGHENEYNTTILVTSQNLV